MLSMLVAVSPVEGPVLRAAGDGQAARLTCNISEENKRKFIDNFMLKKTICAHRDEWAQWEHVIAEGWIQAWNFVDQNI